jgi:hypothetical protein
MARGLKNQSRDLPKHDDFERMRMKNIRARYANSGNSHPESGAAADQS